MNRFDIILRAGELLDDLVPELDIDERAIKYLKECMSRCAALDEAEKLKMPVIMIKDMNTGIIREYGTDIHDILTICEFDHVPYLAYENLQNGYGTVDARDGYRFIADTYGYMDNKQVIAVNGEIYPSQKPYCAVCGEEEHLHSVTASDSWIPWYYCDACFEKVSTEDVVRYPKTAEQKAINYMAMIKVLEGDTDDK